MFTFWFIYTLYLHMCISFCSPLRENDSHFDSFFADRCDSTHRLSSPRWMLNWVPALMRMRRGMGWSLKKLMMNRDKMKTYNQVQWCVPKK